MFGALQKGAVIVSFGCPADPSESDKIYRMSSRIQSDLLLIDGSLRSCPSRALLKGGSVQVWAACNGSLLAVLPILRESVLADQSGCTAAVSMLWRKNSASKKLLALLRAVVEEAPALQGEAAHATAARTARCHMLHGSVGVIHFFWQRIQHSATLWPALREWIVELGGITSLWTALAWVIRIPVLDFGAAAADALCQLRASVHSVLALTHGMFSLRRPVELAQNSAVIAVLSIALGDLLPRDFAAGKASRWDLHIVFHGLKALYEVGGQEGGSLSAHLHRPLLVFWPYLIAELRRQHRLLPESDEKSAPQGDWLLGLKVLVHTQHTHYISPFMQNFLKSAAKCASLVLPNFCVPQYSISSS